MEYISQFEIYLLSQKRVSLNTSDAYVRDIKQLLAYLISARIELGKTKRADLVEFLYYLKYKKNIGSYAQARKISSIKTFYKFLQSNYNIDDIASTLITPKREHKLPNYLSEQEIEVLLTCAENSINIRNKIMLYLLYVTGMRISELCNLTICHIKFDIGFILVDGKGGRQRLVPIPHDIVHLLTAYVNNYKPVNYLFTTIYSGKTKKITRQAFWCALKKIAKQSGIQKPISPHVLRHSLATHLLKNGASTKVIQALLGHEDISTVQIYTHIETTTLRKAYDKYHPRS